jgi:O-antigen ligase
MMLRDRKSGLPHVTQVLVVLYGLFFAGYFLIPHSMDGFHYKLYYVLIVLLSLPVVARGFRLVAGDRVFVAVIAYLAYMLLSITWSDAFFARPPPTQAIYDYVKHALHLLIFLLGTKVLMEDAPLPYARMRRLVFLAAGIGGLAALLHWYSNHPFPASRLEGATLMRNPNDVAFVYGAVAVWGFGYVCSSRDLVSRSASLAVLVVLVLVVLFTQSRGALVALACAVGVFWMQNQGRRAVAYLSALLAAIALAYLLVEPLVLEHMIDRGDMHRATIWASILAQASDNLLLGSGYLSDAVVEVDSARYNAHSAYLATLRDGGIIGLLLLAALVGLAGLRAYRLGRSSKDGTLFASLVFAVVCLATSGDRLLDRPKELWFFFWLPVAMIIATGPAENVRGAKTGVH